MNRYETYLCKAEFCVALGRIYANDVNLLIFYSNAARGLMEKANDLTISEAEYNWE